MVSFAIWISFDFLFFCISMLDLVDFMSYSLSLNRPILILNHISHPAAFQPGCVPKNLNSSTNHSASTQDRVDTSLGSYVMSFLVLNALCFAKDLQSANYAETLRCELRPRVGSGNDYEIQTRATRNQPHILGLKRCE